MTAIIVLAAFMAGTPPTLRHPPGCKLTLAHGRAHVPLILEADLQRIPKSPLVGVLHPTLNGGPLANSAIMPRGYRGACDGRHSGEPWIFLARPNSRNKPQERMRLIAMVVGVHGAKTPYATSAITGQAPIQDQCRAVRRDHRHRLGHGGFLWWY